MKHARVTAASFVAVLSPVVLHLTVPPRHRARGTMRRLACVACFGAVVLAGSMSAVAQLVPLTLTGDVYEADGVTQVPLGTPVNIFNVDTGHETETATSGPPFATGHYLIDLSNANGGDTVIVSSFTDTHEGSETVVLAEPPSVTTADVILDQLVGGSVPTVSAWGIVVTAMSLLTAGTLVLKGRYASGCATSLWGRAFRQSVMRQTANAAVLAGSCESGRTTSWR